MFHLLVCWGVTPPPHSHIATHRGLPRLFFLQVMGLRRQKNYSGRWDVLIQQATQCLNRLIEIAARKRRNYILDQVLPPHPHWALILATVSQCALMITLSNGLSIYLSGGLCVF